MKIHDRSSDEDLRFRLGLVLRNIFSHQIESKRIESDGDEDGRQVFSVANDIPANDLNVLGIVELEKNKHDNEEES